MIHSSHNPFKFAFILNHSSVKTYQIQFSTWFLPELQSTAYIDFCLYEDGEGEQMFETKSKVAFLAVESICLWPRDELLAVNFTRKQTREKRKCN